jgi:iron complex outermembrane receptor protein
VKWCNISFSVDNLLDRQYYYYYVTPGRTWWLQAGLKY